MQTCPPFYMRRLLRRGNRSKQRHKRSPAITTSGCQKCVDIERDVSDQVLPDSCGTFGEVPPRRKLHAPGDRSAQPTPRGFPRIPLNRVGSRLRRPSDPSCRSELPVLTPYRPWRPSASWKFNELLSSVTAALRDSR